MIRAVAVIREVGGLSGWDVFCPPPKKKVKSELRDPLGLHLSGLDSAPSSTPSSLWVAAAAYGYSPRRSVGGADRVRLVALPPKAHWWTLADPDGSGSFQNCKAESLTALPYHLVRAGMLMSNTKAEGSLGTRNLHGRNAVQTPGSGADSNFSAGILRCRSEYSRPAFQPVHKVAYRGNEANQTVR